jgi:HTH-type transcriptional regulator / antitoxin HipB
MRITNARELGQYVRERRRLHRQTQADLAAAAAVSRRWLADLEAGKPTVEIGLVFRTLATLELVFDVRPRSSTPGVIDLDEHLRTLRAPAPPAGDG